MEETVNGGGQHEEPRGTNGQVSDNGSNETDAGGLGQAGVGGMPQGFARMSVDRDAARYNMSHKQRGHCVIFNHRHFDQHTGLGERNGTDRDRDQAQALFTNLGFQVTVYNNLRVYEVKEKIQDLAFDVNHSECDALAVVFMSHGEKDVLWGRDGTFNPDYLFENFKADQCSTLAGKPKLFFIQACRGEGLDAGHFSWRNTTNGSWFIQSLVKVLTRDSGHDDLLSMMTSVNRNMILNFESNCPSQQHMHGKKQAACIVSTLMRKVYFTPKY
ncbi:caspase 2 [Penaeus vannamei]|uniref:Caspase 2 n=1 Tax=Penaeus vannamei TaxID=6689 RepID=A0A3R7PFM3_PENVA|nr:caspase 2 [Penaeus vannamei]